MQVLDSTASAHASVAFLRALAAAYRASGRTRPLVDAFGHNPYPRTADEPPGARHADDFLGEGDYARLAATLRAGFAGTAQRSLAVWYLEDGYQSQIPAELRRRYHGRETVRLVTPPVQAARVAAAIRLAACQPLVRAFFNFELVDERRLAGWQSGLIWRGARPKPAAAAFAAASREAAAGQGALRVVAQLRRRQVRHEPNVIPSQHSAKNTASAGDALPTSAATPNATSSTIVAKSHSAETIAATASRFAARRAGKPSRTRGATSASSNPFGRPRSATATSLVDRAVAATSTRRIRSYRSRRPSA